MTERKEGLVGQFLKHGHQIKHIHCVVHQEVLCGKICDIPETMKSLIAIINKIRGGHNALTHRQFKSFLDELDANYKDLLMHTDVRWLSRGTHNFYVKKYQILRDRKSLKY